MFRSMFCVVLFASLAFAKPVTPKHVLGSHPAVVLTAVSNPTPVVVADGGDAGADPYAPGPVVVADGGDAGADPYAPGPVVVADGGDAGADPYAPGPVVVADGGDAGADPYAPGPISDTNA